MSFVSPDLDVPRGEAEGNIEARIKNKELKQFGITNCDNCVMCGKNESIEHAFIECQSFLKLSDGSLQWFNSLHKINVSLTSLQLMLSKFTNTNQQSFR